MFRKARKINIINKKYQFNVPNLFSVTVITGRLLSHLASMIFFGKTDIKGNALLKQKGLILIIKLVFKLQNIVCKIKKIQIKLSWYH